MSAANKKAGADENYEKPSKHRQWQERSERPIASRPMTKEEIEEHRENLVRSYQCSDDDITIDFQKIIDENDEDRDDCLWLKYKMKRVVAGKPEVKDIFSIKLPIPEELKRMAEQMRKANAARTRAQKKEVKALPAPEVPAVTTAMPDAEPQPVQTPEDAPARPKLKKPARIVKR